MFTIQCPVRVEVSGEDIVLSQSPLGPPPPFALRVSAEEVEALVEQLYFARKAVWQRRNDADRQAEQPGDPGKADRPDGPTVLGLV